MPKYELNVRDYIRILRKRRMIIIVTFIAVLVGTVIYLSTQPVVYESSTTIKIEERKTVAGLLTEWILYSPADIMESETKLIKGYEIMKQTALRLGMINERSGLDKINGAVGELQGSIVTEQLGGTNMIRIITKADTAKRAMDIANSVAEVYMEENLLGKAKQVKHARQFIEEQLVSLENRMKASEVRIRDFGADSSDVRLAEPIEKKLTEMQFDLAEATQRYTEKHPRVVQLREQIVDIESQIKGFSGKEIEYARLVRETDVNKKLYAMLREKLEEARITEAQKVSDITVVDPAVEPGSPISTNKRLALIVGALMGLVLGASLAFVVETLDTSISTIEDVESMVKLRVLGLVPPLGKESKKKKGIMEDIREKLFPAEHSMRESDDPIYLIAHFEPTSTAAEAFRNIHTNLKLDPTQKTILITSSGPREGKSSIASNLAVVMAQSGLKTLLVSADLRRPSLDKVFGIKRDPGMNEYITGAVGLKEVLNGIVDIMVGEMDFDDIRKTPGLDNITIIPSGRLSYNPAEVLKSKEIKALVEKVKNRYDLILFDAPPVLPVTDASLLAPSMDCVILVYEIGRTSREALVRTKIQLESVGAKITGVVLNHTQPETEAIISYPYYKVRYGYAPKENAYKPSVDKDKAKMA
ncbi:MAG: polysaccharide biosynthesis tyrosine autokinase [Candidatus Omnitrophica bacterium]|nr:polysaccharide biosynthesis tyrosine autokinase [Candidatus Omnitrophota bacterium]